MLTGMLIRSTDSGFRVDTVASNSPAGNAGIRDGYTILKVNNIDTIEFIKKWGGDNVETTYTHYSKLFQKGKSYSIKTSSGTVYSFFLPAQQSLFSKLQSIPHELWIIFLTGFLFILLGFVSVFFARSIDGTSSFILFMYSAGLSIINAYSYAANTIEYSMLNFILFDFSGAIFSVTFLSCVVYFATLGKWRPLTIRIIKTARWIPFLSLIPKYVLILFGVHSFFNTPLYPLIPAMMVVSLLFCICTVLILLHKIPRQSSILLRFFLMGLCFGAFPVAMKLLLRVISGSFWITAQDETFFAIIPLLFVPISLTSALLQSSKVKFDTVSGKIMTIGGTLVIVIICVMSLSSFIDPLLLSYFLLALTPIIYIFLEKPVTLFLFPRLEYMQKNLDSLETDVFLCDNLNVIYERTANWILSTINASFICFYALSINSDPKSAGKELFRKEALNINDTEAIPRLISDRLNSTKNKNEIVLHNKDGFSVPLYRSHELFGYIFIGRKQGYEVFSSAEIRLMPPVARIMMESVMMYEIIQFKRRTNKIHDAFSKYLSSSVVENLMENPELITMNGVKKQLTIMFTDLQGFTTLSENTDASILVHILNHYLNEMSSVILEAGGTIDKFEGDAIMCFFGDPVPMDDNAIRCCTAALKMLKMEKKVNDELIAEGALTEPLHTRIGINTGEVIVGNIGSMDRLEYTIIGKQVNIASRIEPINKIHGTSILISEYTYVKVKDAFECRRVDDVVLRGLSSPIALYELVDFKK